jgi:hypothetical protein
MEPTRKVPLAEDEAAAAAAGWTSSTLKCVAIALRRRTLTGTGEAYVAITWTRQAHAAVRSYVYRRYILTRYNYNVVW